MSRGSSRLHMLERRLKAQRPHRVKARALTVMRLEEDASGVRTTVRPPRLPKDMEEQIAVVRGRTPGKPSRGLLQLEQRLLQAVEVAPPLPVIQRHEHSTSPAPQTFRPKTRAQAASIASGFAGGRYNVESFEDASAGFPDSAGLFTSEDHPSRLPRDVPPITPIQAGPSGSLLVQRSTLNAPQAGQVLRGAEPDTNIFTDAGPWALQTDDRRARERVLTSDQMAVAANFERDVAALLGSPRRVNAPEDNQWNSTLQDAAKPKTSPTGNVPAAEPPDTPVAPKPDAHQVFNQMGLAMNYANNFDLGSMDVSARFDRFEQELALDAKSTPVPARVPIQALALDDFDLVADLAEISGVQSATPVETANEPPTTSTEPETTPTD